MKYLLIAAALFFTLSVSAQGTLRGKVTDENGEDVIGANVYPKKNPSGGTITDFEGRFSLSLPIGKHTIVFSFIGYNTLEQEITITDNKVVVQNFQMSSVSQQIEQVVVTGRGNRASNSYLDQLKIKSAASIDFISREQISRTGDSYVEDAVKRVTGVTTVGGYITVRGLADRYNKSTINGSRIPTLDPYTNNIRLDLFPTSLIDNIIITKTLSPENPSDWAGSYISIETKQYPEKLTVSVKSTFGYNTQSTFNEMVTSDRSSTDWLGYDNGFRDIEHPTADNFPYVKKKLTDYEVFIELGLEDYFSKNGITKENFSDFNTNLNNTAYILSLIEAGFLAPGNSNDLDLKREARQEFNKLSTDPKLLAQYNQPASKFGKSIPENWDVIRKKAPLDFSQDFSIGNQVNLFKRPLGFLIGLRYANSFRYDPDATRQTISSEVSNVSFLETREIGKESNSWSALLSLAYKVHNNHSISFKYMPNFSGKNLALYSTDFDPEFPEVKYHSEEQFYEERQQLIYQAQTKHFFPSIKLKSVFDFSFTDGESNVPDYKGNSYTHFTQSNLYQYDKTAPGASNNRIYRYLDESVLDMRLSFELPLSNNNNLSRKIKFGAAYMENSRNTKQYKYKVYSKDIGYDSIPNGNINEFLGHQHFEIDTNDGIPTIYYGTDTTQNFYRGYSEGYLKVLGGYVAVDYSLWSFLRIAGGIRVEYEDRFSDQTLLKGEPVSSDLRQEVGPGVFAFNPSLFKEANYLPSVNLIFTPYSKEGRTINTRFNYSKSLARPSVREISNLYNYDILLREHIVGNPNLKTVYIDNYDLRLESLFKNGDNVSVSLFYKSFENHIEIVQTVGFFTWVNAKNAEAYGIEIEGKKTLVKGLEIMGNITFIESQTEIESGSHYNSDAIARDMYGQAPYVLNGMLSYSTDKLGGLSAAISYNRQGEKLALVNENPEAIPGVYELPRDILDFKISKNIGKNFSVEFKARNILNSPFIRAYDYENWKYHYDNYAFGTNYSFSVKFDL